MRNALLVLLLLGFTHLTFSQNAIIRGTVYDKESGDPIPFSTVQLLNTQKITASDLDGFYNFSNLSAGAYTLQATALGYDTVTLQVSIQSNEIKFQSIYLNEEAILLDEVNISAQKFERLTTSQISSLRLTPDDLQVLPSVGGESDIAQYLPVLPGVVSSGEQGGQLYIRGGSPIQNKILLDGMTIYNPFHSIGLFSVFETETVRSFDVYTGGFGAIHGGRLSAVVDIKTREGDRSDWSGMVAASPFQAKAVVEGPLAPFEEDKGSISLLLTGKLGFLDQTSKQLYDYAVDTNLYRFAAESIDLEDFGSEVGLPYSYQDFYGKISFVGAEGSKLNAFGFSFADRFDVPGLSQLEWTNGGGGINFTLIPTNSTTIVNGTLSYTDYQIGLVERNSGPRESGIDTYNALLRFTYFGENEQLDYGFEFNGFNTAFEFENEVGQSFEQNDFTTEISGFVQYRKSWDKFVLEPGFRFQYYASQSTASLEPRLAFKYNFSDDIRFKGAGGIYSQNLISTFNDLDVVNLFVGFLAGPQETLFRTGTNEATNNRIQKAWHAIAGLEWEPSSNILINLEGYYKDFTQLININRNKVLSTDPDFIVETGDAYGVDLSLEYNLRRFNTYLAYSLAYTNRFDGVQEYAPVFDRRHNVNVLANYIFDASRQWSISARWNLGSGFPFTQTLGFYHNIPFDGLGQTDVLTANEDLSTLLSPTLNGGRLPYYHRLDVSLKWEKQLAKDRKIEIVGSVTNVYNRENVFYVDRESSATVNQLPILPALRVAFYY
ncbi:MAG: TonB-dependent receptor [Bacteroidota bacterium]